MVGGRSDLDPVSARSTTDFGIELIDLLRAEGLQGESGFHFGVSVLSRCSSVVD